MTGTPALSIAGYIASPLLLWFPVAIAGAAAIIGIIAIIYMLSTFTGRQDLKVWARAKIYEVLMAIVVILIFFAVVAVIATLNFQQVFNSAGLVSAECLPPMNTATDFFTLAVCNMYQFNQGVANLVGVVYELGAVSAMVPQVKLNLVVISTSFNPISPGLTSFLGYLVDIIFAAFVLSQVQLLLLAASLLLFSLFLGMGLIARIFSVTRSFGGAMIALGVGLGIIYPMLVCLTYGYINVRLDQTSAGVMGTAFGIPGTGIFTLAGGMIPNVILFFIGSLVNFTPSSAVQSWLIGLLTYGGLAGAGLIFIPFLNFIIVDIFVIDFSQAIGERMDFLKLFTSLV